MGKFKKVTRMDLLEPAEFLAAVHRSRVELLDLRAEVEFARGHFPRSKNLPLLHDQERQAVGTTYKEKGQAAAIALGHTLVDPDRESRVRDWKAFFATQPLPVLACWRGGLRSQITQQWLNEAGVPALRVRGGYKAIRNLLLRELEKPRTGFLLSGLTGSGKSELLSQWNCPEVLHLESLANHRGSSFGKAWTSEQPSQQTFENALAFQLFQSVDRPLLLEHESRLIGRLAIPEPFFQQTLSFPLILLEAPLEERIARLHRDYVKIPQEKYPGDFVRSQLESSLESLRSRLGNEETDLCLNLMREQKDRVWIERLLVHYYDKRYEHSMKKVKSKVLFRGNFETVTRWLETELLPNDLRSRT